MNKENVRDMIDRKLLKSFTDGDVIMSMKLELLSKIEKFTNTINSESKSCVDIKSFDFEDLDQVSPLRMRYTMCYVKYCYQRIDDLDWILTNKWKFRKYSLLQIFKLIKLKEKLSFENSLPF